MSSNPTPYRGTPACPGEWRRPGVGDHRSPCPGLNSLANTGYLPRDGRVTARELLDALNGRFGLARFTTGLFLKVVMNRLGEVGPDGVVRLDLAALALHGFLEHDASLSRRDAREGDASEIVQPLVEQLLSLSQDGRTLSLEDFATAHQLRLAQSAAGGRRVSLQTGLLGTMEIALLYLLLRKDGVVTTADVREFLETERLPASAVPGKLGMGAIMVTAIKLAVLGNMPGSRARKRARDAR